MKITKKKRALTALILATLFAICSFFPEGAVYAAQPENADRKENKENSQITGFAALPKENANITIYGRMPLDTLLAKMPKTLEVSLEGVQGTTSIPVTWTCAGDFESSHYFYYQFNPKWDETLYQASAAAREEIPYIGVSIYPRTDLKLSSGTDHESRIYQFLKEDLGLNTAAACGVLSNIRSESNFNPTASVIDTNQKISYGICQWNGPRFESLKSYCSQNGYDYRNLEGQLHYLQYELEHSERSAFAKVKDVGNSAEGAYQAGYNWARYFERCASVYFESRANLARDTYWPKYAGKEPEKKKKYKVTYELNGGTNHSSNPVSYNSDTKDIVLRDAVKKGYIFEGWYTDSGWDHEITEITSKTKKNLTLYACWSPIEYTIRFYGNKATSGSMEELDACEYNRAYKLTANSYKRKGYTFVKWNTKRDGSGKSYTNKKSVKNLTEKDGAVIKLYAQWSKDKYTITYHLNGGKAPKGNPEKYETSTSTFTLKNPSRKGYSFDGWYKDSKYTKKITQVKKGSSGNLKLYAKWKANQYKVVYKGNGAKSGSMNQTLTCKYGKKYTLKSNAFRKKGYDFAGWNTRADGTGKTYKNKASIKNLTSSNKKTVTLYAQWKKSKYTIKYVLNGGVMVKSNPKSYNYTTKTFKLNKPERAGYTFSGWYTDSGFKNKITEVKKGSTKNLKLYAKWKVGTYTIVFDGNKATRGTTAEMTSLRFGTDYALNKNGYARKGYQFIGWSTNADGSEDFFGNQVSVQNLAEKPGETVTLYAQWEKI